MKKTIKLLLLLMLTATLFALAGCGCQKDGHVASGVTIMGVDVSDMTQEEVAEAISGIEIDPESAVTVNANGAVFSIKASDVGASFNVEQTAAKAVKDSKKSKAFPMSVDIDPVLLDEVIAQNMGERETHVIETSARVVDGGIEVTNGTSGVQIDRDAAIGHVAEQFGLAEKSDIELELKAITPAEIDYDAFLSEFGSTFKEPEYVMADDGTITVTESAYGVEFDTSTAVNTMKAHTAEGEVYTIECTVIKPNHTKEELEGALFRDTMATYSTSFASSSANRCSNIELASNSINGTVLMPGDQFSFNNALGERTTARGYKTAGAYANGETVQAVGGGICQVSSTLYNSVLLSNLEIVTRRSHQMTVSYVPMGRDATVNWGTQDFVFKNNTDYPVKIVSGVSGKKITISIVGTLSDPDMRVEILTSTVSVLSPSEEIVEDITKPADFKEYKYGSNGYIVDATRVVYSGNTEVSRQALTRSNYNPTKTIVTVGTMPVEVEPTHPDTPADSATVTVPDDTVMPPGLLPDTPVTPVTPAPETTPVEQSSTGL